MKQGKNINEQTYQHICEVRTILDRVIDVLGERHSQHDLTKMMSPEKEIFEIYTPKLKETTYGSDEYKQYLKEMQIALDHHYKQYRHHPEHFEHGINDMTLIDLIEMVCDWMAATKRHADGDIMKSIEINKGRFGYSDQLATIFVNTIKELEVMP